MEVVTWGSGSTCIPHPDFGIAPAAAPALLIVGDSRRCCRIRPWDMGHCGEGGGSNEGSVMLAVSHPTTPPAGPPSLGKKGEDFREYFPQVGKSRAVQRELDLPSTSGMGRGGDGGVIEGSSAMTRPP